MKSSKNLPSELDSENHKKKPSLPLLHSQHSSVNNISNLSTNFKKSQNILFNKTTHIILEHSFALKSKIGHANKTDTVRVVLYFQAPTIPIPSRKI